METAGVRTNAHSAKLRAVGSRLRKVLNFLTVDRMINSV